MVGMRMGLEMRMGQQLVMTPQLQQAIKLLQLSRFELEELISQSLIDNPALEAVPAEEMEDESFIEIKEQEKTLNEEEFLSDASEWRDYIESGAGIIPESKSRGSSGPVSPSDALEATVSSPPTLIDHLLWQLDVSDFSEVEQIAAEYLIGNINHDGYLSLSIPDLLIESPELPRLLEDHLEAAEKAFSADSGKGNSFYRGILEKTLVKIQDFDPPGVAARSLRECLSNQLKLLGMSGSLAARIINENMPILEKKDLKKIARLQNVTLEETIEAYNIITQLEPKPGRPFGGVVAQYIIPDVFIYKRGSRYTVSMNQENITQLKVSSYYKHLLELAKKTDVPSSDSSKDNETYQYIQDKVKSGDWLIKSIEQRQNTIYRVAKSILKFQEEFFEKGVRYLKPLVLKDVADDIDVHESTVSRITNNKYAHTPQGILELKYFFTGGVDQGDGDVVSSKKIKDYIKTLIESEDEKKPYTDLKIEKILLEKEGIKIARRTIAKYRESMNILPSYKRKKRY